MPPVPLFRKADLLAAFRLVLPAPHAESVVEEWWKIFAADVDPEGYFLYDDPVAGGQVPKGPQVLAAGRSISEAQRLENERRFWGSLSLKDRKELLLRFSSFHLGLLGLVSDELRNRVQAAHGWTSAQIAHNQEQMRRIVAALNGR